MIFYVKGCLGFSDRRSSSEHSTKHRAPDDMYLVSGPMWGFVRGQLSGLARALRLDDDLVHGAHSVRLHSFASFRLATELLQCDCSSRHQYYHSRLLFHAIPRMGRF